MAAVDDAWPLAPERNGKKRVNTIYTVGLRGPIIYQLDKT
jgi:hypothetical protein